VKLDVESISDLAERLRASGCASMELVLPDGGKLTLNLYPADPKPSLTPDAKDPFDALGERDEPVDPDDEVAF